MPTSVPPYQVPTLSHQHLTSSRVLYQVLSSGQLKHHFYKMRSSVCMLLLSRLLMLPLLLYFIQTCAAEAYHLTSPHQQRSKLPLPTTVVHPTANTLSPVEKPQETETTQAPKALSISSVSNWVPNSNLPAALFGNLPLNYDLYFSYALDLNKFKPGIDALATWGEDQLSQFLAEFFPWIHLQPGKSLTLDLGWYSIDLMPVVDDFSKQTANRVKDYLLQLGWKILTTLFPQGETTTWVFKGKTFTLGVSKKTDCSTENCGCDGLARDI